MADIRSIRDDSRQSRRGEPEFRVRETNANAEHDYEAEQVPVIPREQFVEEFAEKYTPSHLTMLGPTQRGKTTLGFQLLHAVLRVHPKWKAVILHGKIKGRDHTMEQWAKKSNYRIVRSWPPGATLRPSKMRHRVHGHILRPLKKDDITAFEEEKLLKTQYEKALRKSYHTTGKRASTGEPKKVVITVIDERAQADKDLKLTKQLDAPLQRGLPDNPEWNFIQRGAWCSYHCYDAPEHIFLFLDDDSSNIDRYAEFGCADPRVIKTVVSRLKMKKVKTGGTISQCLYMRRSDRYMCIVDT